MQARKSSRSHSGGPTTRSFTESVILIRKDGFVRKSDGSTWTDAATHDPGVTLMPILVFILGALGAGAFWKWRAKRLRHGDEPIASLLAGEAQRCSGRNANR